MKTRFPEICLKLRKHDLLSSSYFSMTRSLTDFSGITNIGKISFLTSVIHQFYMIKPLRNLILGINDGSSGNWKSIENKCFDDENIFHQLKKMFAHLLLSEESSFNPELFCSAFKVSEKRIPLNVNNPGDAHEFMHMLFE